MLARKLFFLLLMTTLLVIPVVLIPRNATLSPPVNSKELAARVLMAGLGIALVAALPFIRRRKLDLPQATLIGYLAAILLSCIFSGRIGYCFFSSWHLWAFVGLAVALVQIAPTARQVVKILVVVVAAAYLVSVYGLAVYLGFDLLRPYYPFVYEEEARNYIHSFIGNPEYFGGYMAAVASVCFAMFFRTGDRILPRLLWIGSAFFFLFALVLSGTRGAILGFFVAAGIVVASQLPILTGAARRSLLKLLAVMCVGAAALFTIFSFPNPLNTRGLRLASRFADVLDITTPAVRERLFFAAISGRMIREDPLLGGGPGTFRLRFYPTVEKLNLADPRAGVQAMIADLQNRVAEHAHNDYLEAWADTGTIGLAALLSILIVAAFRFRSLMGNVADVSTHLRDLYLLRTALFAGATCIFFNAVLSFPLHLPVRASLAWVLTGCFFAIDHRIRRELKANFPLS